MRSIRLHPSVPLAEIEQVEPLKTNNQCDRCSFHKKAQKTVCMNPAGQPGGILFISEYPGREEDLAGKPLVNRSGQWLRNLVKKLYSGPVAYTNSVKCSPGSAARLQRQAAFKHVTACRPYVADDLKSSRPERIIVLGAWAAFSVLGRSLPIDSVSRGYGLLSDGTPVFILVNQAVAVRNTFVRKEFERDLEWAISCPTPTRQLRGLARCIRNIDEAREAAADLRAAAWFTFDIEAAGQMFNPDYEVLSVACCAEGEDDSWVWDKVALQDKACRDVLRELLLDPTLEKVAHNAPYDLKGVWLGLDCPRVTNVTDTQLWRRILNADAVAKLEVCAELVGMGGHKEEADGYLKKAISNANRKYPEPIPASKQKYADAIKEGRPAKQYAFGLLPDKILSRYNARDAISTARLREVFGEKFESHQKQYNVWQKLVKPAVPAITQMEYWGVAADRESIEMFHDYLAAKEEDLVRRFSAYGKDFNPKSPKQVAEILFHKLGLTPTKYGKSGAPSTDADTLSSYRGQHQFVDDLLEHRRIVKMDGTYARGMLKHVRSDGRMHPSFKLDGTETGRLSCTDPNLQNIPRPDSPEGKMSRDIFRASPGNVLIQLDYSQLELRVAAMLSGDEKMKEIFAAGVDYHQKTAELIAKIAWGIDPSKVEKKHRSYAKTVNFGLMYGKTDAGLAAQLGCTVAEAAKIRSAVLGQFSKLAKWIKEQLYFARKNGGVWIPWDEETARWRPLWDIAGTDKAKKNNAENSSVNTPIQGKASDYCLASLSVLVNWLLEDAVPAKLVLTVHDSLIFDVEPSAVDEVIWQGKNIMSSWDSQGVPLVIDAEMGEQWGSLEKVAA